MDTLECLINTVMDRTDEFKVNLHLYQKLFLYEYQVVNQHLIPGAMYLEWIATIFFNLLDATIRTIRTISLRVKNFKLIDLLFLSDTHRIDYTIKIHHKFLDKQTIFAVITGVSGHLNHFKLIRQFTVNYMSGKFLSSQSCDPTYQMARGNKSLNVNHVYARLAQLGVVFGVSFQHIKKITYASDRCFANIHPRIDLAAVSCDFVYHPTLIYCAFQMLTFFLALKSQQASQNTEIFVYLPTSLSTVYMQKPMAPLGQCYVKINDFNLDAVNMNADLSLFDVSGLLLIKMENFGIIKVSLEQLTQHIQQYVVGPSCTDASSAIALTMLENAQAILQQPSCKDLRFALYCAVIFLWASKAVQITL